MLGLRAWAPGLVPGMGAGPLGATSLHSENTGFLCSARVHDVTRFQSCRGPRLAGNGDPRLLSRAPGLPERGGRRGSTAGPGSRAGRWGECHLTVSAPLCSLHSTNDCLTSTCCMPALPPGPFRSTSLILRTPWSRCHYPPHF